ncbi:MAG TPA: formylglycine-generating enzyme family protein [Terriglobales bacterium]|nr:formylglycine-generating enzyme family protein [Terriglobales bacterium]
MSIDKISALRACNASALISALIFLISGNCLSQTAAHPAAKPASPKAAKSAPVSVPAPMVRIHAGTFSMGIDAAEIPRFQKTFGIDSPELFRDEVPKHQVTIDDYYIDQFPVTNADFKRFTDANPEWQQNHVNRDLDNGNYLKHWNDPATFATKADHPVVNVNWYAAMAYCHWTRKRLPTEAEWEFAARGGRNTLFPWGDQPVDPKHANYAGSKLHTTTRAGIYPANGFRILDMAGNVWEFLTDEWKPYPSEPQKNPAVGGDRSRSGNSFLQIKARRVIRGGSYDGAPVNLWVEYRDSHPPNGSQEFVGFRCAM